MVGVLAMAAAAAAPPPVKDYEIEVCKKRRRDDDRSSSETITKYLSPVEKTGDRVFSPPKSSNILDYFRKTSPTNEKTQLAGECKIKSSAASPADIGKDCKIPLEMFSNIEFKKRRKTVNLSHQLSNIKPENESPIEINSDDSKEDSSLNNDVVESSTSVSLKEHVEMLAESIQDIKNQSSIVASKKSSKKVKPKLGTTENDCKNLRKRKRQEIIDLSESLPLAEELNLLKKDGKDSKQIIPSLVNEMESTTNNITKPAQLNDGTITVSYEEFLKSHKENKLEQIPDSTMSICVPSKTVEGRVTSGCTSDTETCEISQQVPFKTVTVLAQVHPIPPKKTGKIPSIFLKQKQLEMENSLSDPENEQTIQKRKSNVVIREEELELAVLEAASSEAVKPKCTLEERQQFMKAFRQPASDALKNGVKKSSDKQKEPDEKSLNEEERDSNSKKIMENPNIQMVSDNGNSQSHTNKGSFPKGKCKKLKKKDKKMLDIGATSGENREGNPQMKETTFSFKGKQSKNRLRMSLRQKKTGVFKDSPLFSASFICEDTANDDPLKIFSQYKKSSRKTSTPVKDKEIYSKAETEDSLVNVFTPKSTRRSVRGSRTPATIIGGTDSGDAQDICPVKASTPRASNLSEKHTLYTAELITVSSDSESPIRMKFTRISIPKKSKKKSKKSSKKSEATGGDFTYQTRKASNTSKNVSKAKQLIEKAKALHISRSKAAEEIVTPLRRSSRRQILPEGKKMSDTEASNTSKNVSKAKQLIEKAKALHISRSKAAEEIVTPLRRSSRRQILPEGKKMSDTEDSVIIINSSPTSLKHPETNQKKLQCLNDVLGKKPTKTSKNEPDTSERSQDCDVRLKAKRDFLMSGLPDLLKRQIAKKSAALDVYNAVSTSFQRVVHVQQKDDGCSLWHLKPPTCSRLIKLKQWNTKVNLSKCVIALGEFSTLNSNLKSNNSTVVFMGRRKDFTEEVRNLLLEEITWLNPEFSLRKYFPLLLKKKAEHQVLSECHCKQENPQLEPDVNLKETKRKRVETKNHKSKRRKPNEYSENPENINGKPKELEKTHNYTGIKLDSSKSLYSKTRRKTQTAVSTCEVESEAVEDSDVLIIDDDKASTSEISSVPDSGTEDMLWTEKYQPQNSSELIGNELAIKKLHSWLKDWKRRAELEERQNLKGKRDEKQEDLSDSIDFKGSSDEEENRLCNTVLITGPTGVGKTAAVYACAQELGFKIFEVNASSQRSGRQILSQLKEATQSHQVDKQGVNAQKPCFFNSYNIGKSPKKLSSPKKVVTSPRRLPPSSPQSSGPKRALPPKTLANYFKVSSKPKNNEEIGELPENNKGIKNFFEQKQTIHTKSTNTTNSNVKEYGAEEPNRKNATSLILFEEHKIRTKEEWHKLIQILTEFQMRNVDFLYSNLEFILPLPVDIIPETEKLCGSSVSVDTSAATKNMKCLARKHSGEKPLKKSQKKKHKKKMVILDDSDLFDTNLDFSDEFLCLHPESSSSSSEESKAKESNSETKKLNKCLDLNLESNPHLPKTPAEKKCSALVSHCLNSLAEFMDNMSFLDALLTDVREQKELGKHDFSWTNGKVKSGLCDEFSLENSDGWTSQSSGELKAAVEALSFTKCSSTISKALETLNSCKKLGRDPMKDLTLSVSQKRTNVYFSQSSANLDCAWKRIAVIKSVFSSRSLLNLGNRQASIIEYLPTLRNICRTEKLKEQGKSKRRFLHYLEGIHLNIAKETVNTLAADFP
ncbi:ATPase family AAA domain-containing protein 5 [Myotis brandtii]|uniref:ATPase family AAA domain-containing protein 5 n=1 Tax=Myotis brandtii TaxID=109478 RepID=S7Q1P3_MYOBR|nr:ATPase family AAA domain-containing protein 5 [Myotis brandtii]